MANENIFDVLIVGLGPVGAIAANVLGQFGHFIIVVEQNDGHGLKPRAGGFDDEAQRILQNVGLIEAFMQTSNTMPMGVDDGAAVRSGSRNGSDYSYRGFYQPKFEEILRQGLKRFPNVSIRLSTRCLRIDQTEDCVEAELQEDHGKWEKTAGDEAIFVSNPQGDIQSVRSKFVLGCDGARSVVRQAMGTKFIDLGFDERWWATDLKLLDETKLWGVKLPTNRSSIDLDRSWGLVPLWKITDKGEVGRHVRFEFQVEAADEQTYGGDLNSAERIRTLISNWLDLDDYELVRFAMYHFRGLLAEKWRNGRLLLAGDAAHTMPPYMGQGLNQGFKDIVNVSWKLSMVLNGVAGASLLDTYEAERAPIASQITKASVMIGESVRARRAAAKLHTVLKPGEREESAFAYAFASSPGATASAARKGAEQGKVNMVASGEGMLPTKKGVTALGIDLSFMNSKLKQRTDSTRQYPALTPSLVGKTFPQVRVRNQNAPRTSPSTSKTTILLDDRLGQPATFVLVAVSHHGTKPTLSAEAQVALHRAGGFTFQLALTDVLGEVDAGCTDAVVVSCTPETRWREQLRTLAPFAALLRPDRFVLGATHLDRAEALVEELGRYLADPGPGGGGDSSLALASSRL